MNVRILVVPYDSGHRAVRMGRGPLHLIEYGLEDALEDAGHDSTVVMIDSELEPPTEVAVAFEVARALSTHVREARRDGVFPLVLAGNCASALGTVAGLGPADTGVLWLDAHADLNTPETTQSGFLDGMAVAALTGRCWTTMTAGIPGFAPVPDGRVAYAGVRDLDAAEEALLGRTGLRRLDPGTGWDGGGASGLYVHVDLDVLDPEVARANAFAAEGGLAVEEVLDVAGRAADHLPIIGAALTAFDPAYDDHGQDSEAATAILLGLLERVARSAPRR